MDSHYNEILLEEVYKYASHYFSIYKKEVENGEFDFSAHFDYCCDFNDNFFAEIIYNEEYFLNLFRTKLNHLIKKFNDDEKIHQENEAYRREILEKFKNDFKTEYVREYITRIEDLIAKLRVEKGYITEDVNFYLNREYIGKEEEFGGPISEEERNSFLMDANKSMESVDSQIKTFEKANDVLLTLIAEEVKI